MSHCLSFLLHPSISQSWDSWRIALLRLFRKIRAYNGPFTGLEVRSLSASGNLSNYSASGKRTDIILSDPDGIAWRMGGCVSTNSKPPPDKRKRVRGVDVAPISAQPISRADSTTSEFDQEDGSGCEYESPSPRIFGMSGATKVACLFTQQGRKGLNQDAMIVCEDFGFQKNSVFCGVFDGHGTYGHLVAQHVRDLLPSKLASNWEEFSCATGEEHSPILSAASNYLGDNAEKGCPKLCKDGDVDSQQMKVWKDSFLNAYLAMDKELLGTRRVDCSCSGTTAVTLVKQGKDVIIGNVGDSRAILATKCDDGSLRPVQLTVDLKPNLPEEAERIKQCKGRVFALQDEPEVHRVWLPDSDSPGLAMSRAFGDSCLKNFGVISVPEVTYHPLTERDQFIILATDGVWDVLSNQQVVNIVSSVSVQSLAAKAVVEKAVWTWRTEYPTSQVDDCAVVCLFVQDNASIHSNRALRKESKLSPSSIKQLASHAILQNSGVKELLAIRSIRKKIQVSVSPNVKDSRSASQEISLSKHQPQLMSLSVTTKNFRRSETVVLRKSDGKSGHQSSRHTQFSDNLPFESCSSADNADNADSADSADGTVTSPYDSCENGPFIREGLPDAVGDDYWTPLKDGPLVNSFATLPRFTSEDSRAAV